MSTNTTNPWHYKPWWCQPWSILLTGTGWMGLTYVLLGPSPWWLIAIAPVVAWMGYFLVLWPRAVRQYLEQRVPPEQE